MGWEPCENATPDCKYWFSEPKFEGIDNGCFSDTDHIYGRARGLGRIARRFCMLPENKRQICRAEHDEINATFVHLPLPDIETMKRALEGNNGEATN